MFLLILLCVTAHGALQSKPSNSMNNGNDNRLEMIAAKQEHPRLTLQNQNDRASRQKKDNNLNHHFKTINSKRDHSQDILLDKPKKTTDIENHLEVTVSKRDDLADMTVRDDKHNFNEIKQLRLDSSIHKVDMGDSVGGKPQKVQLSMKVAFDPEASEQIRRLTRVLEQLNEGITTQLNQASENANTEFELPVRSYEHRRNKRSLGKVSHTNVTAPEETVDNQNKTIDDVNGTECNSTSGCRRSFSSDLQVSNAIKIRLLSYIHEYFNDITKKINSLKNVKNTFATDDEYNIGYMIANIDMLEVNLSNLKVEMEANKHQMGEKQILDLFDKVKVSNGVVSSLLTALKSIVERHTEHHQYNVNQYQVNK